MPLLTVFGELERFTTQELYPHRYLITPLLIAAGLGALYAAYRLGAHLWVRRNPAISAAVAVPMLVFAVVAGDYFLSPLWERSYLEEQSPLAVPVVEAAAGDTPGSAPMLTGTPAATTTATTDPLPTATATAKAFQPRVVYSGSFSGADDFHFGRGDVLLIETEPGKYVLRFENFSVRNGPDLFVYLSEDPGGESIEERLNLGSLKATDGAFNYEISADVDISRVRSAVVWCRQFGVLFAHAELQ